MEEAANTIVASNDVAAVASTITSNVSAVAPSLFVILGTVLAVGLIMKLTKRAGK